MDPSGDDSLVTDYRAIGDYAIIGDCRTAALIAKDGSLDWVCMPRFDSPSLFAAVLDRERGGWFRVRPTSPFTSRRRYLDGTNVLETTFEAPDGVLEVTDLMPVASEAEKRGQLWPDHQILRSVYCSAGAVEVDVECRPRPQYGRVVPRYTERRHLGFCYQHRGEALLLRSDLPLSLTGERDVVRGRERLQAGQRRTLALVYARGEPAVMPSLGAYAEREIKRTTAWWRQWTDHCRYDGPYRDAVVRSALVLKLLTYAPSGAVVAAPTTSLPEHIGGVRNWDYRYCWLRDASMTLQALVDLGYDEEAKAFFSWLIHSTRLTRPELQVVYDVHGETRLPERELDWLEGYRASRPVRVGNAAGGQLQLDVYGEVVDAAFEYVRRGGQVDSTTGRLLAGLGDTVCRRWEEPDEGIWEPRGGRRRHTYSAVMCWVALDRLLRLSKAGVLPAGAAVQRFGAVRAAIQTAVEAQGYHSELGSYTSELNGDDVDATLLMLPRHGFANATSPRMRSTFRTVQERLGEGGLLRRYRGDDGLTGEEGAFVICSFWAVDYRCRAGLVDEAVRDFEHVCSFANDVGLFAEEIDPRSGAQLGNFPQAFTHVGLIDAALTLAERTGRRREATASRIRQ